MSHEASGRWQPLQEDAPRFSFPLGGGWSHGMRNEMHAQTEVLITADNQRRPPDVVESRKGIVCRNHVDALEGNLAVLWSRGLRCRSFDPRSPRSGCSRVYFGDGKALPTTGNCYYLPKNRWVSIAIKIPSNVKPITASHAVTML
jgi:hypothetical protein